MLQSIGRAFRIATGHRFIEVVEESATVLVLRALGCSTRVDTETSSVSQNGKHVAALSTINDIYLSQPINYDGPPNWRITLRSQGSMTIEVGYITDGSDASLLAAKLANVTGKPVNLK